MSREWQPTLDLTDPMVREMADRNHIPKETWSLGGQLLNVGCYECSKPWPCPTRQALRATQVGGGE